MSLRVSFDSTAEPLHPILDGFQYEESSVARLRNRHRHNDASLRQAMLKPYNVGSCRGIRSSIT